MQIFLVGGAVRDKLLGLPVTERDWVVVGSTPQEMLDLGYYQVGKDFPVFIHPTTGEEYALARTERKSGSGYTGFTCYSSIEVTLEQDLQRRDLTINAIAEDSNQQFIDPYNGLKDIENRILRHISPAFGEDPLRVLRVARFAARFAHLGFTIAPETLALMKQIVDKKELFYLSPERIWKETEKALATEDPQFYFQVLHQVGALAQLFPEIDKLFGIPAPEKWHPEIDTGIHTMLTLKQASLLSDDISVRFSALCHDVGKGLTPRELWPHHYGHPQKGVPLVQQICLRLRVPNHTRDLALLVCQYHDLLHNVQNLRSGTLLSLFEALDLWRKPERLEQLIICSTADSRGRYGWEDKPYPQADYLRKAFDVVKEVPVQQVIADNFSGSNIKIELYRRRIAALTQWIASKNV